MKFVSSLAAVLLLTSCVTYRLQPLSPPSGAEKGDMAVQASALWAPEIQFSVKVTNQSGKPLVVDSDQFRLYVGAPGEWNLVPLITSDEYYRRAEAQPTRSVTIVSSEPTYQRRITTSTTTIGGSGGSVTIVRREPQVVVVPQETRVVTITPGPSQRKLDWLKENLFYSVTLEPGKSHEGLVYGPIGKGTHYKLVLPVDGKDYEVVFERVKERGLFKNLD